MFNIFKQIKKLKMENEDLELQVVDLRGALDRANEANRDLNIKYKEIYDELNKAYNQIRILAEQVKMYESQNSAKKLYSDSGKNY
jgi:regulator of replication initiation timing